NAGATATFNGNLTLNCTNLNAGSGIIIGNDGTVNINGNVIVSTTSGRGVLFSDVSGSVTLGSGYTISAGSFTTGTLKLARFIQTGGTAQNIALTGTASVQAGPSSQFNGSTSFSAPQMFLNGSQYNNTAILTKNGATDNTSTGANIFNGSAVITNSGTGLFRLANTTIDDFNSDATFIQTGSGLLQPAYATNCTIAGNLSTEGTSTPISFGTVTLNGTGPQLIGGSLSPTFTNLNISNTGNTVSYGVNSIVTGNLSVISGIFDLGAYTTNRLTSGGTLSIANGATLKIGGTNTIPFNYTAHSVGATSTIEYAGTNQTVTILNSSENYGNLTISGSGTKSIQADLGVRNNVTVTAGTLDIATYILKIGGSISNSGSFIATNGTIEMNGTAAQTIPATAFAGKTINNLTINNIAGVTLADTLKLTNDLTVSNGALVTGGFLVLRSSATATARVAQITSTAGTPISGNVIAERYVIGRRKYRLISSPVTTHANATLTPGQEAYSIWGNWQNSGINTTPNVGELITGGSVADGFDAGTTNASLYTYDDVNRVFKGYTTANGKNTRYTPLKAGIAYLMFVYGDRLNSVFATNPHNTVLSALGTLKTGTQTYNTGSAIPLTGVTGRFTLLGNPFASPINWATIPKTDLANAYWGWDPNLNSTGGYITVTTLGAVTLQAPYSGSTGLNQYIQSGQGFFVKTTGPSPVLTIREQDKAADFNALAFRPTGTLPLLAVNLQYVSSGTKILADGVLAVFDPAFPNAAGAEDATKMANTAESMAILNDTTLLSIDARQMPQNNDTLYLNVSRLTKPQYILQVFAEQMDPGTIQAFLQDRYLNTLQPLTLNDTNSIVFNVSAGIPASADVNRFRIVFHSSVVVLPVKFISIKAIQKNKDIQIDWSVAEESGIKKYEIERSADGTGFNKAGEITARGNNSSESYYWLDASPVTGSNYYRVRAVQQDGEFLLSKIVVVKIIAGNTAFKVFPNPVINHQVNIRADVMAKGQYTLLIYNQQGQQVIKRVITHVGGAFNQIIDLPEILPHGIYYLQLTGENVKYDQTIFLE
ncbi:MAG TPA: T9SS type A sorting domain-containing protein, partial [Ferruginibacter sp.]|nr:T9SS type A sorting domain-containing protein [Ferruginibacter sp.]